MSLLMISGLIGFLIPAASAAVIFGVKSIAKSETTRIVAAEASQRVANTVQGWENDKAQQKNHGDTGKQRRPYH